MYVATIHVTINGRPKCFRHSGPFASRVVCSNVSERVIAIIRRRLERQNVFAKFELTIY